MTALTVPQINNATKSLYDINIITPLIIDLQLSLTVTGSEQSKEREGSPPPYLLALT